MMRVLVAFSLSNGKTQPYSRPAYQLKRMLVLAASCHATWYPRCRGPPAYFWASTIGLRLGMVRLTREYTRLSSLPRSASSSRRQQPHHQR